ncbi:MAG: hypothetical protein CL447_06520 [Acidimicrobiaceae bacterium]|nr:hypothetical protein [Acidimicrobiaceae bacterium]
MEIEHKLIRSGDWGCFGELDTLAGIEFSFAAVLWRWPKRPAWHFVTVPFDVADEVENVVAERGGFNSVRIEVRVGASVWFTSMFPSRGHQSLILPVKRQVRDENQLGEGDKAMFFVRLV